MRLPKEARQSVKSLGGRLFSAASSPKRPISARNRSFYWVRSVSSSSQGPAARAGARGERTAFFVSPDRRGHPGAGSPIPDACATPGDRSWPSLLRRLWLGWLWLRTAKPQPHSRARKRRRAPREGRRGVPALRAVHAATGCTRVALVVTGRSLRAVDAHELRRHRTPEAECRDLMRGEPNVLEDALRVFAECADRLAMAALSIRIDGVTYD